MKSNRGFHMLHRRVPNWIAWPLVCSLPLFALFTSYRTSWKHARMDQDAIVRLQALIALDELEKQTLLLKTTDGGWIAIAYRGPGWHIFAKDSEGRFYRSPIYQGTCRGYHDIRRKWRESGEEEKELWRSSFTEGEYASLWKIEQGPLADAAALLSQLRFEEIPSPQ